MNLNQDKKSALNQACQQHLRRPITKTDIVYTANHFGGQCQAIVKLNCMNGQEYAGHLTSDQKAAEKSAAEQALQANAAVFKASSANAAKAPAAKAGPSSAPAIPVKRPGELNREPFPKKVKLNLPAEEMVHKTELNNAYMKIIARAPAKGDMTWNITEIGGQFQATVQLPHMPGEWASREWAGELREHKQLAEQSAALQALNDIRAEPTFAEKIAEPSKSKPKSKKGVMRKTMNKMVSSMMQDGPGGQVGKMMAWMSSGCNGPAPRDMLTPTDVEGSVVEWKGTFGWLKPDEDIKHETASWKGGKVYVHKNEFATGCGLDELVEGQKVKFKVYADHNGLGATGLTAA